MPSFAEYVCRGMALMGKTGHPSFPVAIGAIVDSHQQRALEPRLMRQLFQAVSAARALGHPVEIPADLEGTAHKWYGNSPSFQVPCAE